MSFLRSLTLIWPGLPWAWLRGSYTGLILATAFAICLSLCIITAWIWTSFIDIEITFGREGVTCGTGDKFVTSTPKLKTDIVDMEAFAIAKVCKLKNIDFRCFKFISDNADSEAKNDWVDNVSRGTKLFIEKISNLSD